MALPQTKESDSPTPIETPESETPSPDSKPENIFEVLSDDESSEFEDEAFEEDAGAEPAAEEAEEPEPPAPKEPETPAAQEAEAPKVPETPQPTPAPETPTAQAPQPQPAPSDAQRLSPQELQTMADQAYGTAVQQLTNHYALDADTAKQVDELLGDGASQALSGLFARVYVDAVQGAIRYASEVIPPRVMAEQEYRTKSQANEDSFFTDFPQLDPNNPQHKQTVYSVGHAIKAQNPNLGFADFKKQVAAASMFALGIVPQALAQQPAPPPAPAPFVPAAGAGRSGAPTSRNKPSNVFEQFAVEDLDWDIEE